MTAVPVLLLRTTAARLLAPPAALLASVMLLTDSGYRGNWGQTTLVATSNLVFLLPIAMLAGALDGRRLLRPGFVSSAENSSRPVVRTVTATTLAAAAWVVGGYGILLATGYAATARLNPQPIPPVPVEWIAGGVAALFAHTALGVLLGRYVPVLVAAGIAGVVGFLGNLILADQPSSTRALFTVVDNGILGTSVAARPLVILFQASFFVVLTAALIVVVAAGLRSGRAVQGTAATLAMATLAAGIGLGATGGGKVTQAGARCFRPALL